VAAQVLLQIEDRQRITLIERQKLAELRIGLDGLLVHQIVGAGIGHYTLRDGRAADLRILGLAKERAELRGDLHGLREDAGLGLGTLNSLRLALAAAIGLLDDASRLLLNNLERGRGRAEGRLEGSELLVEIRDRLLERGTDVLLGSGLGGRRNNRRGCNSRCRGDSGNLGCDSGLHGLGLHGLDGDRGDNSRHRLKSSDGDRLSGLHGLLGGLDGRTHFSVIGGTNCGHGTRVLSHTRYLCAVKFGVKNPKVAALGQVAGPLSY